MGSEISENDLIIIATRFNRGSDMSREKLEENTAYGKRVIDNKEDVMGALTNES